MRICHSVKMQVSFASASASAANAGSRRTTRVDARIVSRESSFAAIARPVSPFNQRAHSTLTAARLAAHPAAELDGAPAEGRRAAQAGHSAPLDFRQSGENAIRRLGRRPMLAHCVLSLRPIELAPYSLISELATHWAAGAHSSAYNGGSPTSSFIADAHSKRITTRGPDLGARARQQLQITTITKMTARRENIIAVALSGHSRGS